MSPSERSVGLDAVRGVALVSMFVAHFAPSPGPASVLTLSEHLTAFLFVLLIGCGAELGRESPWRWRAGQVRSTVLVAIGLLLMQLPSGIVVVLVWLGVITVLAVWLTQLPSWAVALVGVIAAGLEPRLIEESREWLVTQFRDPISAATAELLFAGHSYRVMAFVLPACAGILLARHVCSDRARLAAAGACLPIVAVLFVLDQTGAIVVEAYTGTFQELVFNTTAAVLTTCLVQVAAPRARLAGPALAAVGAMALTLYSLQVVGDWVYLRDGTRTDDSWGVLLAACAGAVAAGVLWLPVARQTGWRGPLEGAVDRLARGRRSGPEQERTSNPD